MQIKKRLTVKMDGNNAQIKAVDAEENSHPTAKKSSGVPVSVSAALGSLKKKESPNAITGGMGVKGPSANTGGMDVKSPSANTDPMDDGHSEAYKERLKKRVK